MNFGFSSHNLLSNWLHFYLLFYNRFGALNQKIFYNLRQLALIFARSYTATLYFVYTGWHTEEDRFKTYKQKIRIRKMAMPLQKNQTFQVPLVMRN